MYRSKYRQVLQKMRGISVQTFGEPSVLKYVEDLKKPEPAAKQVLIKIRAAGVNPVETYIRSGQFPGLPQLPYTPGTDGAGIVEAIGKDVEKFKVGQRVYTTNSITGTYAEFSLANEADVHLLHEKLSFADGASLFIPYYTAFRCIYTKAKGKAGEHILIHGASGAVGIAACQMASAAGLKVIGTAGTDEGMALVEKNGALKCFNHRKEGYLKSAMNATGGKGFDIVLEMLANVNLNEDLKVAAKRGRIVVIGCRGTIDNFDPLPFLLKELRVDGVLVFDSSPQEILECEKLLYSGMEKGWLAPVVEEPYNIRNACDAHTDVIEHKKGSQGKIVLKID